MKNKFFWGLIAGLVLLTGVSASVSAETTAADRPGFTAADSEFYLEDQLFFFSRPGLVLTIVDYEIPSDLKPEVTFTLTSNDPDLDPEDFPDIPLDLDGILTPGAVDIRWYVSYIPVGEEQLVNYNTRSNGWPTADSGGTYTTIEMGTYTYKYGNALPADYEKDATHYLAAGARRDLRDLGLDRYGSNDWVTFVPSGASDPMPRDIVDVDTCNRCHNPLAMHGGRYLEIPLCEQCHNPGLVDEGLTYSLNALIHRVHSGNEPEIGEITYPVLPSSEWYDCAVCHTGGIPTEDLPMIANPNPASACDANGLSKTTLFWADEGNIEIHIDTADGPLFAMAGGAGSADTGDWVMDGQTFVLVDSDTGEVIETAPVNNTVFGCATNAPGTYRGTAGSEWDHYTSHPARAVCGGCHANIDFATGENTTGPNHPVQTNDDSCGACHVPDTGVEFDRSVVGAHTMVYKSNQLPGVLVDVISITNTGPNRQPLVTFSIADKFGPIDPNSLQRLRFSINGPNEDFDFRREEDVPGKAVQVGTDWQYRFTAKLPSDATGSYTFGVEGRKPEIIELGDGTEVEVEDQIQNFTVAFAVTDDEPMARRVVVDDAKCENCHSNLSLHGENRHNATSYCQTCHQPDATDEAVRPPEDYPLESIHFKYMIHKIHAGEELQNGYVVYGYRGSVHDFGEVQFPGQLNDCRSCHADTTDRNGNIVDALTYTLPLPEGVLPTFSPNTAINPFMLPITASCLSCHDSDDAAAHADANTSVNLGESCGACHGEGKTYSVTRVHAR